MLLREISRESFLTRAAPPCPPLLHTFAAAQGTETSQLTRSVARAFGSRAPPAQLVRCLFDVISMLERAQAAGEALIDPRHGTPRDPRMGPP